MAGPATSAAELIILALDHIPLTAMAYTDYDADATELLETYGMQSVGIAYAQLTL